MRTFQYSFSIGSTWLWLIVVVAWCFLIVLHNPMAHHSMHTMPSLLHTFTAWEAMIGAMMLPSVVPVAQAFNLVSEGDLERRKLFLQISFLSPYLLIWTLFAIVMIGLDTTGVMHQIGLDTQLGKGFSLVAAGLFQFSPLKLACLRGCRSATAVVTQYYQPGLSGAWRLGWQHGLYCLGCCWALMAEMAILGFHRFWVMALFTAIMLIERFWKNGTQFAIAVGIAFLVWGIFLIANSFDLTQWWLY